MNLKRWILRVVTIVFFTIAISVWCLGKGGSNCACTRITDSVRLAKIAPRYAEFLPESVEIADSCKTLEAVFEKMARIRNGSDEVVSILHIGDSHVQAGFLSRTVRELLHDNFGDAGRGLIVPLKIAGTNEPRDYSIISDNNWTPSFCTNPKSKRVTGVAGIAIETESRDVNFTIKSNDSFTRIRVIGSQRSPLLFPPPMVYDVGETVSGAVSDTVSRYLSTIELTEKLTEISIAGRRSTDHNEAVYYGFSLENGKSGILYHSAGVNGATFGHFLNNSKVAEQYKSLSPDLIIVSLGTNDGQGNGYDMERAKHNIAKFVTLFGDTPLLMTTPMESYRRDPRTKALVVNQNMKLLGDIIISTAKENGLAYWDMYEACGGSKTVEQWSKHKLFFKDNLHLLEDGYTLQGRIIYNAIVSHYNHLYQNVME